MHRIHFTIDHTDPLTEREAEVLLWTAEGKTAWETGRILGISEGTVRAHLVHALDKLKAATKSQAVGRCIAIGVLTVKRCFALAFVLGMVWDAGDFNTMRHREPIRRGQECRPILSAGRGCMV